tara:strand:+ start:525 stop:716 length:192 start_codon:yes stop_codon:yes gene_type:complete
MTIVTKGMGAILKGRAVTKKLNLKTLDEKLEKLAKEKKIRKLKQDEEVMERTGFPFKQAEDPE